MVDFIPEETDVPLGIRVTKLNQEMTHIDPAHYFRPGGLYGYMPHYSTFRTYIYPIIFTAGGILTAVSVIAGLKRPVISGLQYQVLGGAVGCAIGFGANVYTNAKAVQREQFIYDYIRSHPDDFPVIERKKIKDVFKSWYSNRM